MTITNSRGLHRKSNLSSDMNTALLNESTDQAPEMSPATVAAIAVRGSRPRPISIRKSSLVVGACFLAATFSFAIGNALIHSYFFSSITHSAVLVAGVFLLGCGGLAVATNGVVTRRILAPYTRSASRTYVALRMIECLTIVAVAVYFATVRVQWDAYVLAVYAVSGAAGLVLSRALLTSGLIPRSLARLGLIGYPVFIAGTALSMFHLTDVTHGVGMLALVPGGLFELILPIWLFTKGFAWQRLEA